MSGELIVRPVNSSDFTEWLPLWNGYNTFYGRTGAKALPDVITQTAWSRFLDDREPMHALVAELDGHLVGLAHYLFHRNVIMINPVCYMQDLFTAETARGKGVGRALIEAVYDRAKSVGSTRAYWQTAETNLVAQKLYDRLAEKTGFIFYGKNF